MALNLQSAIIMLLCINIALFAGGVRVIDNDFLDGFISTQAYTDNSTLTLNPEFNNAVPTNYAGTGSVEGFNFIDAVGAVKSFLIFMVNIIFTPLGLFMQLPKIFGLMLGVPLLVISIVSFIYFVRSGK